MRTPLCKNCALFIVRGEKCGRAHQRPDYVSGRPSENYYAQVVRESLLPDHCGPEAKFFRPIPVSRFA